MDISSRDIRNRKIARELLTNPTQSYAQIAEKIGVESLNVPRQTIYQYIHTNSFKAIMAEEIPKFYDENKLKRKLDEAIDATKPNEAVHKGYLELGMRSLGMLIDKTINENHDYNESDLDKMRMQAINDAMDTVRNANVLLNSESGSLIENIDNKGVNAQVSPSGDSVSE